jgi:hypothetical protein
MQIGERKRPVREKRKEAGCAVGSADSIRVADSLKRVQNRLKAMEEARLDSIKLAEEERMLLETRQKYNIVVGSFLNHDNAVKWLEEYGIRDLILKLYKCMTVVLNWLLRSHLRDSQQLLSDLIIFR